ncbi:hypothetical protein MKK58_19560 [Methylobacterium sp. J-078]|uniref:hypothetical protein n=1 Tax=Methylobacterium sp. J-078 TaxID=2836657 RepID=UPI001FB9A652|nr:hypothetical protein [Methylobacterium sp. J-078]MCJ2046716.1 hypothetical protein [Methylobacterium sp. J-078]
MTTLIAWAAYDQRRPSSFYLASDSRITWGSGARRWDAGRKIFASNKFPDLFGYAGDVVFPCLCLSQIVDGLDHGVLVPSGASATERAQAIFDAITRSFSRRHQAVDHDFTIFHASRDGDGKHSQFMLWTTIYETKQKCWHHKAVEMPNSTSIVAIAGSGGKVAKREVDAWIKKLSPGLSRSIFSGFCDAIERDDDPLSGGAPQLAGLYLSGSGMSYGILHEDQPFLHGLPVAVHVSSPELEWRDRLFQRLDGQTLKPIAGAQRHARPTVLRS